MKLGHLHLPLPINPDGKSGIHFSPFFSQAFTNSSRANELGKPMRQKLLSDPRFKTMSEKLINDGGGGSSLLSLDHLVAWYLYRANEVGVDIANSDLEIYLDAENLEFIATVWIYGVTVETKIALANGIDLVPIYQMPISQEKFDYLQHTSSIESRNIPAPHAALVKKILVPKIVEPNSPSTNLFETASTLDDLAVAAILLNAAPGVCSMPGYSTFYREPSVPTYPFGGSSGGTSLFDTLPNRRFEFKVEYGELASKFITSYKSLPNKSQRRTLSALQRLAQAKGRWDIGDICLDLGIALEMVLLNSEHEGQELPGQLSLHFRLRGSWLIGSTPDDRKIIYKHLGKIYSLRSQVAHNGYSDELMRMRSNDRDAMLAQHFEIAEKILTKLIVSGTPKWSALVLGDSSENS